MHWLTDNATPITIWCAALSTFAVYSILYAENKFYRLFEHIFIGLAAGLGVYLSWSQILGPLWWDPLYKQGHWYWAFAAVAGSMFYFMYTKKQVWISRIIFGYFMGAAAGGIFRTFFEVYFPQIRSSMKPLTAATMSGWDSLNAVMFYVILFSAMSYFFFSFNLSKHKTLSGSAKLGRWFLMIGFGAIFGATVMGRMTLFIGRFNFLINTWGPEAGRDFKSLHVQIASIVAVVAVAAYLAIRSIVAKPSKPKDSA